MVISQQELAFRLGEPLPNCDPILLVYPTVILQLTTISLLMSFSSGALAVLPAFTSPVTTTKTGVEMQQTSFEVRSEDYLPITDSKNVEKFLNDYFADIPILAKIGKCESQYRHFNSRGEVLRGQKNSYDRGVMQINLLYHEKDAVKLGLNLHDIDDNVAYARYLYEKQGSKPWMSSSPCWGKFAPHEIAKR